MVFSVNPSLCKDVPPPSEKIGETGTRLLSAIHRRLFSRIFLREGGRLYTGYVNPGSAE